MLVAWSQDVRFSTAYLVPTAHFLETPISSSGIQRPPQLGVEYAAAYNATVQNILDTVTIETATFENVILPYLQVENEQNALLYPVFLQRLGTKPELDDAINNLSSNTSAVGDNIMGNADFFKLVDYLYKSNDTSLDEEDRTSLKGLWSDIVDTGVNMPADQRNQYQNMNDRLIDIAHEFIKNVNTDHQYVYFTAEELQGVPATTLAGWANGTGENAGKYEIDVTIQNDYFGITSYAVNETTRYTAQLAYLSQCLENNALLSEAIELRLKVAQLMGYASWADLVLKDDIAHDSDTAYNKVKANDTGIVSPIGDHDIVYRFDNDYYVTELYAESVQLDDDAISAYFPIKTTIPAILALYGQIYGIYFDRIQGQDLDELSPTGNGTDLLWHPDVQLYAVWNNQAWLANNGGDDKFVGYMYLDLFYREGVKAGQGASARTLAPGYLKPDGCRYYSSSSAQTIHTKSDDEDSKPSLIQYYDLADTFNILGHNMQSLLAKTKYSANGGIIGTPIDWKEFPATFMENFAFLPDTLRNITRHWSSFSDQAAAEWRKEQGLDSTAPLPPVVMPEDLIAAINNDTTPGTGLGVTEQLAYCFYDQAIHNITSLDAAKTLDVATLFGKTYREVILQPDATDLGLPYNYNNYQAIFTQLINPVYAGQYYSYLWCDAYAADVFYSFFKDDPFNPTTGMRYRTQVLQPGGSGDPLQGLKNFLGRDPNDQGYYESLNLTSTSSGRLSTIHQSASEAPRPSDMQNPDPPKAEARHAGP
ncbi:unnamed protein product [Zymoseptoria tritici ST99CH_1A5]|uniref:Peptidase M3A/M3B catalytic domain-containing protein n=1 Tax=Zymoseptoria tritici ST99CH_1A5 TaxID=1276529 RepID=A0A1Y6LPX9_ZYMTR|nr:unnamed protein product [Zymoseptoria tritici ST99CH_1A5]